VQDDAAEPIGTAPAPYRLRPSPIFIGLLAVTLVSGIALYAGVGASRVGAPGAGASGVGALGVIAFVFVAAAWVVSLCLHEFGHALVAYRYGDQSVLYRGYLTLDPLRYTHVVFSLVLPLVFVLLGGIGLPGGAVFIDRRALRSRFAHSAVSAAGPLANIAFVILLSLILNLRDGHLAFWAALAFLLFLQVTAVVLNILPVPGLDGFGIIEPYLPQRWLARAARIAPYAILILFGLLWIPPVNRVFFSVILAIVGLLGAPTELVGQGYGLFRFWTG